MTRIKQLLALALSLALVAACNDAPTATTATPGPDFKGGKPPSTPPVSVSITPTSPGLLPDNGGAYVVTPSADGAVEIRPACGSRSLALQNMGALFDAFGDRTDCNGGRGNNHSTTFLKFPGIMEAQSGACPDLDAPDPTVNALNFGVNSRYFFETATGGYTLVITDCNVVVTGNTRRVTATAGVLWAGQQGPDPVLSPVVFNVDLTITQ